jgi:hypothetical protein
MNVIPVPDKGIRGQAAVESTHNVIPAEAGIQDFTGPGFRIKSGMTKKFTKILTVKTNFEKYLLISDCI